MLDTENQDLNNYYECINCNSLYVLTNTEEKLTSCAVCNQSKFRLLTSRFIIHCPKCFEYWSKNVVKTVRKSGLCKCLNTMTCDGILKIRKELSTESPSSLNTGLLSDENTVVLGLEKLENNPSNSINASNPSLTELYREYNSIAEIKTPEKLTPGEQFAKIYSNLDISLNPTSVSPKMNKNIIEQFFLSMKICYIDEIPLDSKDYIDIFSTTLLTIDPLYTPLIKDTVEFVYYVGDINGDFEQVQRLINYFHSIIEKYPSTKVVILGNYFNKYPCGIECFALLCLFFLKFPNNVRLLRGANDFHGKICPMYSHATNNTLNEEQLTKIYRLILHVITFLPIYHISLMNQGEIAVYSNNSGIPINPRAITDERQIINIEEKVDTFKANGFYFKELDSYSQFALDSYPEGTKSEKNNKEFNLELITAFFQKNNFHYMVRSNEILQNGYEFQFENNICCTIFSTQVINSLDSNNNHQFQPKILRLVPGQEPTILDTIKDLKNDLEKTFGISSDYL